MDRLDELLSAVRKRFRSLPAASKGRAEILAHLEALSRWHAEPFDYEVPVEVSFPERVQVVHAVCHPECGHETYVIDGEGQRCRCCGGTLLRVQSQEYRLTAAEVAQPPAPFGAHLAHPPGDAAKAG